jgi:hypothetical protein
MHKSRNKRVVIVLFSALLALSGCAPMPSSQCGQLDGYGGKDYYKNGFKENRFSSAQRVDTMLGFHAQTREVPAGLRTNHY